MATRCLFLADPDPSEPGVLGILTTTSLTPAFRHKVRPKSACLARLVEIGSTVKTSSQSHTSELFVCVQLILSSASAMEGKNFKLDSLPDEIIVHILHYVDPEDAVSAGATCKRLNNVSKEPALWRDYCLSSYKYWAPERNIQQGLAAPAASTDWRQLFRERRDIDRKVDTRFNSILTSTVGRIPAITAIAKFDYDAKDALLRHLKAEGDTESYLARKYWAKAVLGRIRREKAIEIWSRLARGEEVDNLTAISAYDLFVLDHPARTDPGDIEAEIQHLAEDVRATHPNWHELSTRSQALKLAEFLQHRGFHGVREDDDYRNLPNNFVSLALADPNHEALPLICAVIYCSIAQRLGLKAHPIGFPMHVYVVVRSPKGQTLDGKPAEILELTEEDWKDRNPTPGVLYAVKGAGGIVYKCYPESMFIDAFHPGDEVPVELLKANLSRMGFTSDLHAQYLKPMSTVELLVRTGNNIMESCQNPLNRLAPVESPDTELAYYSAMWIPALLSNPPPGSNLRFRLETNAILATLCWFIKYYPWDANLIEDHIIPLFRDKPQYYRLVEPVETARLDDLTLRVKCRHPEAKVKVKHKIGQVFTHRRYGYEAVIIGWDTCYSRNEAWIQQMGVDGLSGGRNQSFYSGLLVNLVPRLASCHANM